MSIPTYGTKLVRRKTVRGIMDVRYVVSHGDYLVQLSSTFPDRTHVKTVHECHIGDQAANKRWIDTTKGVQLKLLR